MLEMRYLAYVEIPGVEKPGPYSTLYESDGGVDRYLTWPGPRYRHGFPLHFERATRSCRDRDSANVASRLRDFRLC